MNETDASISYPAEFILTIFTGTPYQLQWISLAFSLIYVLSMTANTVILAVIKMEENLHEPMYIFICMLAIVDMILCNTILPKMLSMLCFLENVISFEGCLIQMFFVHTFSVAESSILLVMSFDRYIAICNPLRYKSIFTSSFITKLSLACFIRGFIFTAPEVFLASRLPYCSSRVVSISYCDHMSVVKLACADTTLNNVYGSTGLVLIVGTDAILIIFSYIKILQAVKNLASRDELQKAINTCGTHLCVVLFTYTVAVFSLITQRMSKAVGSDVLVFTSCLYLVTPGMLNPIIYGAKTKEIRSSFIKQFKMH
ncbi:olfactory receptor 52K1-like [Protopterus annectens]|uniref:olfactory receptor 52K1-like n=1 Tax=Protopterus annectens TaxID=7888 RepID=UPI001CFB0B22|nr:olfactory receptor 52K1-like [Protopterus annectens]